MSQNVAVERLAELRTERAAAYAAGQTTEDGARHGTQSDTDRAGERADSCTRLATSQGSADATCNTAHGTDGGADFHGVMEGRDFGGVTARALQ